MGVKVKFCAYGVRNVKGSSLDFAYRKLIERGVFFANSQKSYSKTQFCETKFAFCLNGVVQYICRASRGRTLCKEDPRGLCFSCKNKKEKYVLWILQNLCRNFGNR